MENGLVIRSMALVCKSGPMEKSITASGPTMTWKVLDSTSMRTKCAMTVNSCKTRSLVSESTLGQTVVDMKDGGTKVSSTDMETTRTKMVSSKVASGKKARGSSGSISNP